MSQVFRRDSTKEKKKQNIEILFWGGAVKPFPPPPSGEMNSSLASPSNNLTFLSGKVF